jgi:SAM-dependent methyltransferase
MRFKEWENYYKGLSSLLIPNEYVVRAFMGSYPNLCLPKNFSGKKVCDVSCGDGRNLVFLHKLGLILYGTEVTSEICKKTILNLQGLPCKISAEIRPGVNSNIPFHDQFFDYCLSWNSIYYLESSDIREIHENISEISRIIKNNGYLVCSVPMSGCYSLKGATFINDSVMEINPIDRAEWGGGVLNGQYFYQFKNENHIIEIFGKFFENFKFCTLTSNCFGLDLDYLIFVCRRSSE